MKSTVILILLLSSSLLTFAQKVKVKKNEVFVDEQKIAQIEEEKAIPAYKSILLQSLEGETWVSLIPEEVLVEGVKEIKYKVLFHSLNKSTYVDLSIGAKKYYTNKLIKTEAVSASGLNEQGVERFIQKFGVQSPTNLSLDQQSTASSSTERPYTIVERNRQATIMLVNGKINQAGRDIARYEESSYTEAGKPMVRLIVKDVEGSLILTASFPKFNSTQADYQINGEEEVRTAPMDEKGTTVMRSKSLVAYWVEQGVF